MSELFPALPEQLRESPKPRTLEQICAEREAWETPAWVAREILRVEILTPLVLDPCTGLGSLALAARAAGYTVVTNDIEDWTRHFTHAIQPDATVDFLTTDILAGIPHRGEFTVFMNPPFTKAVEFVERAFEIGARKIICFQRHAWREAVERREFWERRPPARIWLCGSRATCWLFHIPDDERGSGTPVANSVYTWERGHTGASVMGAIYNPDHGKRRRARLGGRA